MGFWTSRGSVEDDGVSFWSLGGAFSASGTTSHALAGTSSQAASTSGALSVTKPLAGTSPQSATTSGALNIIKPLAGTSTGPTIVSGALSITKSLAGASSQAATTTGTLTVTGSGVIQALAGTTTGIATTTATLSVASESHVSHVNRKVNFDEFWDYNKSPGADYSWGTDTGGNKGYRPNSDIVRSVGPMQKRVLIPASTWSWTHNLGYYPLVTVLDEALDELAVHVNHINVNSLTVNHTSNATGYIIIR